MTLKEVRVPNDRYDAFESKYSHFNESFGSKSMTDFFTDIRYGLYKLGYKVNSLVTVYYLLFYVFNYEPDASKWNIYQPTDIIIQRVISKINKLQLDGKVFISVLV